MRATTLFFLFLAVCAVAPADAQDKSPTKPPPAAVPAAPEPADTPEDATEEAAETGAAEAAPAQGDHVDALRQEYLQLRDRLFRSRARAAAVASTLYSARIVVHLDYKSARFYTVERATIRIDGANVYDDAAGDIASDQAARFTGFVAPGRHVVTVRIEATGKDDSRFATTTESSFSVIAVGGKDLMVSIKAMDEGDIAFAWKKKQTGSYRLHLNASVKSVKRSDSKRAPIKRATN